VNCLRIHLDGCDAVDESVLADIEALAHLTWDAAIAKTDHDPASMRLYLPLGDMVTPTNGMATITLAERTSATYIVAGPFKANDGHLNNHQGFMQ
jgi:hypothetical protein